MRATTLRSQSLELISSYLGKSTAHEDQLPILGIAPSGNCLRDFRQIQSLGIQMQSPDFSLLLPRLAEVNLPALDTATAAAYLNRQPQTLRVWACFENGPIRPIRINGRLAWPTDDVRRLLHVPNSKTAT